MIQVRPVIHQEPMTTSEAIAHDKLLQAFSDRPFQRAEALAMVGEEPLSALVAAGMVDLLEGRLKNAREFLELGKEMQAEAELEDNREAIVFQGKAGRLGRWPLLRHSRGMLELKGIEGSIEGASDE